MWGGHARTRGAPSYYGHSGAKQRHLVGRGKIEGEGQGASRLWPKQDSNSESPNSQWERDKIEAERRRLSQSCACSIYLNLQKQENWPERIETCCRCGWRWSHAKEIPELIVQVLLRVSWLFNSQVRSKILKDLLDLVLLQAAQVFTLLEIIIPKVFSRDVIVAASD